MLERTKMNEVVNDFLCSYGERDREQKFEEWLCGKLMSEMPDKSEEECKKMVSEILSGVGQYEKRLDDLNEAEQEGQSGESWYAEQLEKEYEGMPVEEAGKRLQNLDKCYLQADMELMGDSSFNVAGMEDQKEIEVITDEYGLKKIAYDICEKAVMGGIAVAAKAAQYKIEEGEDATIQDAVKDALQEGLVTEPSEVKAVLAGAVKAVAEKKLDEKLPEDVPVGVICGMACVAAEGAEAAFDLAQGRINGYEAVDKVGKAAAVAGCNYGAAALRGAVAANISPIAAELLSGLFDYLGSERFAGKVYDIFKEAAEATWQGIKEKVQTVTGLLQMKEKRTLLEG